MSGVAPHMTPLSSETRKAHALYGKKLVKRYKKRRVVDEVSIRVEQGEIVGLLGPNGAGKTTTFYMMVGLITPNEGEIYLDEERLTQTPMYRRARKGIGYLAQEASVFRNLTVYENLTAVLQYRGHDKVEIKRRCEELIEEFSLQKVRDSQGYRLSGGERRRTEIARALVTKPNFILLDEPFAGVDPIAVEDIQQIVSTLKSQNIGILITDHNVRETLKIVDKVYIVNEGAIFYEGDPISAIKNEKIKKFYLGENFNL